MGFPIAAAGLVAGTGLLAFALTTNPIDPVLPLSIHTRSSCLNGTVSYPGKRRAPARRPGQEGHNGVPFITSTAATGGATFTTNAVNQVFDPNDVRVTMSFVFPATTANRTVNFWGRLNLSSGMGFGTGVVGSAAEGVIDFGNTGSWSCPPTSR